MPQGSCRRFKSSRSRSAPAGCECPSSHRGQLCFAPQDIQHWALAKVFHSPSSAATCLTLAVPPGKEEKCLQACSSPQCPPAAGGARAKPLPLALHPLCAQVLLLMLLFPKSRTNMCHISDSGQAINQLLISCESAQLSQLPAHLHRAGVAPFGASCLQKPAPRPDPCSCQKVQSVPWVCSRHWACPVAPSPLLRAFLAQG